MARIFITKVVDVMKNGNIKSSIEIENEITNIQNTMFQQGYMYTGSNIAEYDFPVNSGNGTILLKRSSKIIMTFKDITEHVKTYPAGRY